MPNRLPHIVRKNDRTRVPKRWIFAEAIYDTKGRANGVVQEVINTFRMVGITRIGDEDWRESRIVSHYSHESFWRDVSNRVRTEGSATLILFESERFLAASQAIDSLRASGATLHFYLSHDTPSVFRFKISRSTLTILDIRNYFRVPETWLDQGSGLLDAMAKTMIALCNLLVKEDLGSLGMTMPSTSMRVWRHKYWHPVYIHTDKLALKLERQAYYGGRCECFEIGKIESPVYLLDINSCYPSLMMTETFPTQLIKVQRGGTVSQLRSWMEHYVVIARVTVAVGTALLPARIGGVPAYPVGIFDTVVCQPELELLLKQCDVLRVHAYSVYRHSAIMARYASDLLTLRSSYAKMGSKQWEIALKLLANGLSGKWGQRGGNWEDLTDEDAVEDGAYTYHDVTTGAYEVRRALGGHVQRYRQEEETPESFPAISAFLTSYGRVKLWKLMEEAGRENVYYVDTDSLLVNYAGLERLAHHIDAEKPGALKLERQAETADIWGQKHYSLDRRRVLAGATRRAKWFSELGYEDTIRLSRARQSALGLPFGAYSERVQREIKPPDWGNRLLPSGRLLPLRLEYGRPVAPQPPDS